MNRRPDFANFPVTGQIDWPNAEVVFMFGEHEIHAFPTSREHAASLHINLATSGPTNFEGRTVLNQLLSIGAWLDDTFVILHDGWSGSPIPVRPNRVGGKGEIMSSIIDGWCNSWSPIEDATVRRALAIYRDALNLKYLHAAIFSTVGFYKIFEIMFKGGQKKDYLHRLSAEYISSAEFVEAHLSRSHLKAMEFDHLPDAEELADFLYKTGRNAVAHANFLSSINPDNAAESRKISCAANILRVMSRRMITEELGVSTDPWANSYRSVN
jgi:hypothetical protein